MTQELIKAKRYAEDNIDSRSRELVDLKNKKNWEDFNKLLGQRTMYDVYFSKEDMSLSHTWWPKAQILTRGRSSWAIQNSLRLKGICIRMPSYSEKRLILYLDIQAIFRYNGKRTTNELRLKLKQTRELLQMQLVRNE